MKKNLKLLLVTYSLTILAGCNSGSGFNSTAGGTSGTGSAGAQSTVSCISITKFAPTIGAWWISGTFNINNSCSSAQSASNLQLTLSANQALIAANFSLSNISFTPWSAVSATAAAVSGNADVIQITLSTSGTIPANSSVPGSFGYNPGGVTLTGLTLSATAGSPTPTPTPGIPPAAESLTTGTLYFHAYVPQTSISAFSQGDAMTLTGDNYTDLIMSNYIAGVMLGHMIVEQFPKMQFNKDYMYGTIFAQLLQENLETELYESGSTLIDPSTLQASVMGNGQGGPYQINSYLLDMVGESTGGYQLANYIAIQKNIGYPLGTTSLSTTPAAFNNKYYGPMLTAYFHLNDLIALETLENGSAGYIASAAPDYALCMKNLVNIPNNPLEIIMNYAYNQGYNGGLVGSSTADCINLSTSAFVTKYNSYANASGSSYNEYPYQVRFYLDELYNQSTLSPQTNNHVAFRMPLLSSVFSNVFQTLAYINSNESYMYITNTQATAAFNTALTTTGLTSASV